ncbi:MAG: MBL fold metallo-hydrolase [Alphaproteobacteria bacterium]|nr:MBL fold metallo-hydrolase [Alphaproteobacteria bacterium]
MLIDTAPDLREQLIDAQANYIDAVLYTHDHADQTHGIDDLRPLFYRHKRRIPVWMDEATATSIMKRFAYCFRQMTESHYPAILEENRITPDLQPIKIDGAGGRIEAKAFFQNHGTIRSLGYRIDRLIYSPDINGLPQESYAIFENAALWIVDALRPVPHPTHFHLAQTLAMIKELNVKQAVLTNLHIDMDYRTLAKELPDHVVPAYDGMEITLGD